MHITCYFVSVAILLAGQSHSLPLGTLQNLPLLNNEGGLAQLAGLGNTLSDLTGDEGLLGSDGALGGLANSLERRDLLNLGGALSRLEELPLLGSLGDVAPVTHILASTSEQAGLLKRDRLANSLERRDLLNLGGVLSRLEELPLLGSLGDVAPVTHSLASTSEHAGLLKRDSQAGGFGDLPGLGSLPGLSSLPALGSMPSLGSVPGLGSLPGLSSMPGLNTSPSQGASNHFPSGPSQFASPESYPSSSYHVSKDSHSLPFEFAPEDFGSSPSHYNLKDSTSQHFTESHSGIPSVSAIPVPDSFTSVLGKRDSLEGLGGEMPGIGSLPMLGSLPAMSSLGSLPGVSSLSNIENLPGMSSLTSAFGKRDSLQGLGGAMPGIGSLPMLGSLPLLGSLPMLGSLPAISSLGSLPGVSSLSSLGSVPGLSDLTSGGSLPGSGMLQGL